MNSGLPGIELSSLNKNEWVFEFPRLSVEAHNRLDNAIDLWHAGDLSGAEREFRLLIVEYPEFVDAHHHLAMLLDGSGRNREAFDALQRAVQVTIDCFISAFCTVGKRLPWGAIDNRPFLRAYKGLGFQYLKRGEINKALPIFRNILRLNPTDNQGVRAIVIYCYFDLGRVEDALEICKDYSDDTMEDMIYGKALALYLLERRDEAEQAVYEAIRILPLIARELVKRNHKVPRNFDGGYVANGSQDQAYNYVTIHGKFWKNAPGSIDLVKECLEKSGMH